MLGLFKKNDAAADRRSAARVDASAGCRVEIDSQEYPLVNWSLSGFLINNFDGALIAKQKVYVRIFINEAGFKFDFPAEAVVTRVGNGQLGAMFLPLNKGFKAKVQKYFAARLNR